MVSCVTADFFFFLHFAIYGTRIARAGQTQGWWRPVFCSCQQTAPAASKKETRSFIASGNPKINLWEIFPQLPWVENSVMPGGRKVCRSFSSPFCFNFLFLSSFYFGFANIILAILDGCIRSWTILILVKLLASIIFQIKNFYRRIEIGVKRCVLISAQKMSPSSLGKSVLFLTVCIISAWLFGSFRPQWFFVCLLLSLSLFYFCVLGVQVLQRRLISFTQLLCSTQFTVDIT